MSVGMLMMSNWRAMSGFSSTLTLATDELVGVLGGDLVEDGGDALARPAPLGPEVDQDRLVGRGDGFGEAGLGEGADGVAMVVSFG